MCDIYLLIISLFSGVCSIFFFFFKQKTAYEMRISDWSSDVCSSDLHVNFKGGRLTNVEIDMLLANDIADKIAEISDWPAWQAVKEIGRASCRERVCQYV